MKEIENLAKVDAPVLGWSKKIFFGKVLLPVHKSVLPHPKLACGNNFRKILMFGGCYHPPKSEV